MNSVADNPNASSGPPPSGADARALFNPAFLAVLIGRASSGYADGSSDALPLSFGFLVAPLILHPQTRDALPRANARLAIWTHDNPLLRAEWRQRAPRLAETTRRALRFGIRYELLQFTANGLSVGERLATVHEPAAGDARDCWRAAERLGRWLRRSGSPATALALLGVRP